AAKRRLPVNFVLVAEGEEEIGSPHFGEVSRRPDIAAALGKTLGVFMPFATRDPDGEGSVRLGGTGSVRPELAASGAEGGEGPSEGRGLREAGASREAVVPSGPGPGHPGHPRRRGAGDRWIRGQGPTAVHGGAGDGPPCCGADERGAGEEAAGGEAVAPRGGLGT